MPTQMRNKLSDLVAVDKELTAAWANNKLSPEAFLAESMRICRLDDRRIRSFEKALDDPLNVTMWTRSYVTKCQRYVESPNVPNPPPASKMGQVARVHGSEDLLGELSMLGFDIRDGFCLAVKQAIKQNPSRFGTVGNLQEHHSHTARLVAKKDSLLQQMNDSLTTKDLTLDDRGAFISGSDVRFRKGWQARLLQHVIDQPKKPRTIMKAA